MALSQALYEGHVKRWIAEYRGEHPDADPDLDTQALDATKGRDWETPTDFMEEWTRENYPHFYAWWSRRDEGTKAVETEADAYAAEYEDFKREAVEKMAMAKEDGEDEGPTLEDKVADLCAKNPVYARFLRAMVDAELAIIEAGGFYEQGKSFYNPVNPRPQGWELSEIQRRTDGEFTGGHLAQIERFGILTRPYDSNRYTLFRLVDRDAIVRVLTVVDRLTREQASAALLMAQPGFLSSIKLTDDDVKAFEALLAAHMDPLEHFWPALAPKIVGMERAKKAALLTLASTDDRCDNKNRIHTLLFGPPETAKSRIAYAGTAKMGGVWATGRSTKVGLTADASQGDLTPGALPRAHKRPLGVDELDKFSSEDQSGLLEGMEEGTVTINVGKFIGQTLEAEALVVATANELDRLKPELVSRFDFVVETRLPTTYEAQDIAADLIEWWDRPKATEQESLAKWLKWVRGFDPQIPQSVREAAKKLVGEQFIGLVGETRPRKIESIVRIAKALARLRRRDVAVEDVRQAMLLSQELNRRETPANGNGGRKP